MEGGAAGSELILRQIFDRLGERVHLLTPTYALFPDARLGPGFMRITTATPEDNGRFVAALEKLL
jgi:histidinol-phosphate aminotransferase